MNTEQLKKFAEVVLNNQKDYVMDNDKFIDNYLQQDQETEALRKENAELREYVKSIDYALGIQKSLMERLSNTSDTYHKLYIEII